MAGYYGDLDENGEVESESKQRLYYQRLAEVTRGVDTYWMSEPLRFAVSHSHNLFAEGGDDRMRYGLGFSYNKTQGVMKGSDRDVINGNVQLLYRYKTLSFKNYLNLDYTSLPGRRWLSRNSPNPILTTGKRTSSVWWNRCWNSIGIRILILRLT